jgi:hypothetical protein
MAFRLIEHLARRIGELEASLISSCPRGPQTLALLQVNCERDGSPGTAAVAGGQMGRRFGPGDDLPTGRPRRLYVRRAVR